VSCKMKLPKPGFTIWVAIIAVAAVWAFSWAMKKFGPADTTAATKTTT